MIRTLLVAFLLALLASTRASAQAPSAAEEFQRGLEAFEQDRIEAALAHFRSALELDPRDAVRFNIALCLEQLGQHREAAEEYERAASSDEVPEEARRLAAAQAEVNRARLAELRATGWPGARLSVDGHARCTLPCATREDPGAHEIAATLDGRTWSDSVQLRAGERVILSVVEPPARVVAGTARSYETAELHAAAHRCSAVKAGVACGQHGARTKSAAQATVGPAKCRNSLRGCRCAAGIAPESR